MPVSDYVKKKPSFYVLYSRVDGDVRQIGINAPTEDDAMVKFRGDKTITEVKSIIDVKKTRYSQEEMNDIKLKNLTK